MIIDLRRLLRTGKRGVLLLIFFMLFASPLAVTVTSAETRNYVYQIGAWGDDASKGNMGVHADIRTHIYVADNSDFDYFWVGDNLEGGAFIQFGFSYEPGYYCLRGEWSLSQLTCSGSSDNIGSSDARWQWQYWPNASLDNFYYGIGSANSAGENATWHSYSIMPSADSGWSFILDGVEVANITSPWRESRDAAYVIAEKVTNSSNPGTLGPVEFQDLSYLSADGWHPVNTLYVAKGCSPRGCNLPSPYGVSLDGPNHIATGSGLEMRSDEEFLWTSEFVNLTLSLPPNRSILLTTIFSSQTLDSNSNGKLPRGMNVQVSVIDPRATTNGLLGLFGGVDVFQRWTGDVTSSNTTFTLLMSGDRQVQGRWATDFTTPLIVLGSVFALILGSACVAMRRRMRAPKLSTNLSQCPACRHSMYFVTRYQRWYCFNCKRYV